MSGGFEDDNIAGRGRGTGLAKIDRMGKVEWCDRASHRCAATSCWSACGAAECALSLKSAGKCRVGMSRSPARLRPRGEHGHNGPYLTKENMMAKYLLLKHYRGAPAAVNDVPMDQWTPEEISAHVRYMDDFAARLEGTGEFVDSQALSPEGTFVRYDGEGRPPVTDGPFAETKDLIAGWMVIDVESYERALELAGELSAAPGQGGKPIHEWLEVRPFLAAPPTITD